MRKANIGSSINSQSLSDTTLLGSDISGTGKVSIIKNEEEHVAKSIFSATSGNISIKALNDVDSEYRVFPVIVGFNNFGVLFDKIDKSETTITLATTVFLL